MRQAVVKAALLAVVLFPALAEATPVGVVTILEGEAFVIRESVKFSAAEGLRVRADDIVHTTQGTSLARIEFAEGGALDLGPGTQVLLQPQAFAPDSERPAAFYLKQGWVKLTATPGAKAPGFAASRLDVPTFAGVLAAFVGGDSSFAFVEAGMGDLIERRDGEAMQKVRLTAEQGFVHFGAEPGVVLARPPTRLLVQMPPSFIDSLPMRARRFASKPVEPSSPLEITYDDVAMWINAEQDLRVDFRQRWSAKARDPAFRAALLANLRSHPEWARLVLPPKKRVAKRPVPAVQRPAEPVPVAAPVEDVDLPPSTPIATVTVH